MDDPLKTPRKKKILETPMEGEPGDWCDDIPQVDVNSSHLILGSLMGWCGEVWAELCRASRFDGIPGMPSYFKFNITYIEQFLCVPSGILQQCCSTLNGPITLEYTETPLIHHEKASCSFLFQQQTGIHTAFSDSQRDSVAVI